MSIVYSSPTRPRARRVSRALTGTILVGPGDRDISYHYALKIEQLDSTAIPDVVGSSLLPNSITNRHIVI